jgi:hypothetical protein
MSRRHSWTCLPAVLLQIVSQFLSIEETLRRQTLVCRRWAAVPKHFGGHYADLNVADFNHLEHLADLLVTFDPCSLHVLKLRYAHFFSEIGPCITVWANCSRLTEFTLDLDVVALPTPTCVDLPELAALVHLQKLGLSLRGAVMARALNNRTLNALQLLGTLREICLEKILVNAQLLSSLEFLHELEDLRLTDCWLSNDKQNLYPLSRVRKLALIRCKQVKLDFTGLPTLSRLWLEDTGCFLVDDWKSFLTRKGAQIKSLRADTVPVDCFQLLPVLEELKLGSWPTSLFFMAPWQFNTLRTLHVSVRSLGEIKLLRQFLSLRNLVLYVEYVEEEADVFKELAQLASLQHLEMPFFHLGAAGFIKLVNPLPGLQTFRCRHRVLYRRSNGSRWTAEQRAEWDCDCLKIYNSRKSALAHGLFACFCAAAGFLGGILSALVATEKSSSLPE